MGRDLILQLALLAVCARVFTYHNSIDNIVLSFLVLAAATRQSPLLIPLVLSLLIPARIGDLAPVQVALQLFWIATLVELHRKRGD
jgi:hypothetical protein